MLPEYLADCAICRVCDMRNLAKAHSHILHDLLYFFFCKLGLIWSSTALVPTTAPFDIIVPSLLPYLSVDFLQHKITRIDECVFDNQLIDNLLD